jgi:hypothetical protein
MLGPASNVCQRAEVLAAFVATNLPLVIPLDALDKRVVILFACRAAETTNIAASFQLRSAYNSRNRPSLGAS